MKKETNTLKLAFKKVKSDFSVGLVFSFFINLLMLVSPLFMLQAYDRVLPSRSELTLLMLLLIAVVLLITMTLLEIVRANLLTRTASKIDIMLSQSVFRSSLKLSNMKPGSDAGGYLQDVNNIKQFVSGGPIFAFFDSPWVPIFIFFNFIIHPLLGAISLVGAIVIFSLALLNEKRTRAPTEQSQKTLAGAQKIANQTISQHETISAMGMAESMESRWKLIQRKGSLQQSKASLQSGMYTASSKSFRLILQTLILAAGCWLAIHQLISPGGMIAASIIMGRALAPVEQAISGWRQFIKARESYHHIGQLLTAFPEDEQRIEHPRPLGMLSVDKLIVVPPSAEKPVIKGVTFRLEAGDCLAVLGNSGSGKSSLTRALVGVWEPRSGAVMIDNIDLRQWNKDQLGDYIGFHSQNTQFLSGSVAQNIARFKEYDDTEVIEAAKFAGVHELILSLPKGYDTQLDPNDCILSAGQKQLVGLARAVFRKPAFIVLDEPNAHLDNLGDKILGELLQKLKQEKITTVIASHKQDILRWVDKILILKQGQLATFGPRSLVLQGNTSSGQPAQTNAKES